MRKAMLAVLPAGALLLLWRRCVRQAARIKVCIDDKSLADAVDPRDDG